MPNGIPISVIHRITPRIRWDKAIHSPPIRIQIILSSKDKDGDEPGISTTFFPNGKRLATPILKHCKPKGIPIIVMHKSSPETMYSKKISKPPKMIHTMFPTALMLIRVIEGKPLPGRKGFHPSYFLCKPNVKKFLLAAI
jgi:hypothetical protein